MSETMVNHLFMRTPGVASIEVVRKDPMLGNNFRCYFTPFGGPSLMYQLYSVFDTQEDKFVDYLSASQYFTRDQAKEVFRLLLVTGVVKRINESISHIASAIPGIHQIVKNPVTGEEDSLYPCIMDLNDEHGWPREKIAAWVDELDNPPVFEEKIVPKPPGDLAVRKLYYLDATGKFSYNVYNDLRSDAADGISLKITKLGDKFNE